MHWLPPALLVVVVLAYVLLQSRLAVPIASLAVAAPIASLTVVAPIASPPTAAAPIASPTTAAVHPNLLFTKIPKTGSTTMFQLLSRARRQYYPEWKLALPMNNGSGLKETCISPAAGRRAWRKMIAHNGGQLDMFIHHACFRSEYMTRAEDWSQRVPPLALTLMRNPIDQFMSKYRFTLACCEKQWYWCSAFCKVGDMSLQGYLAYACPDNGPCNEQERYMGDKPLEKYFMVLIMERLDESLTLLGIRLGWPQVIPYLRENGNSLVPQPELSPTQQHVIAQRSRRDIDLYRAAVARLDSAIAAQTPQERWEFDSRLSKLQRINALAASRCPPTVCANEMSKEHFQCMEACLDQVLSEATGSSTR
ncbi:hypothetical protein BASA81_007854 [Batrachochytrium salamandrivorans]|nr:hypothetical protein BASA81_007854 [Batrachochytrium salamandrivorans]